MSVLFYSILVSINLIPVILAKEHVPVLLWSPSLNIPSVPSLKHVGSVAFNELVHDALGASKPMIAVFLEENLSNEDFTLRTNNEQPIYGELEGVVEDNDLEYLPSVANPMKTIRLLEEDGYVKVRYQNIVPSDLTEPSVIIVSLPDDSTKERREVLRNHFRKIRKVYRELVKEYPDLLAVYTGRHNSWAEAEKLNKRVRRADDPSQEVPEEPSLVMRSGDVVIVATGIEYKTSDTAEPTQLTSVVSTELVNATEDGVLLLKVKFTPAVELTFNLTADPDMWQWALTSVVMEGKTLTPSIAVEAPSQWSWFCSNPVLFTHTNDSFVLNITGLQAQPFIDGESYEFGQAIDCVPYFSIAIWTGLLVVLLMLFILSWGLMMLMDINTNDRFDDPKGKTITISATD